LADIRLHIGVFASGKGSNVLSILNAIETGRIPRTRIAVVISNNAEAGALCLARERNIPTVHMSRKDYASDESFNAAMLQILEHHGVNFIVLAGYMKKVDSLITGRFRNRIINIHPALLPAYGGSGMYGMHVHEAVVAKREPVSGATVHYVDEEYDHGKIILQKTVPVSPDDTPESLAAKVLEIEHEIYPEALRRFAEGQLPIDDEHVTTTT
jgi:phosphoribosylglycinamide formyltransferase-1